MNTAPSFATPHAPDALIAMREQGPTILPTIDSNGPWTPTHPASHARYLVIDMTENNRHQIKFWEERHHRPHPSLGYGICRQGFGLQSFNAPTHAEPGRPTFTPLTPVDARPHRSSLFAHRADAELLAWMLNRSTPIGIQEDQPTASARVQSTYQLFATLNR